MKSAEEWARGIFDKLWRNQQSEPARQSIMEEAIEAARTEQRECCADLYVDCHRSGMNEYFTKNVILKAGKED